MRLSGEYHHRLHHRHHHHHPPPPPTTTRSVDVVVQTKPTRALLPQAFGFCNNPQDIGRMADVCPLLRNLPPLPEMADEHQKQVRAALLSVVATLWQHPELAQVTKDFVDAKLEELAEAPARATDASASDDWIDAGGTQMVVATQTDAEAGPPAPPPGPPPQQPNRPRPQGPPQAYAWREHSQWFGCWYCRLCDKYADEMHVVSDKHGIEAGCKIRTRTCQPGSGAMLGGTHRQKGDTCHCWQIGQLLAQRVRQRTCQPLATLHLGC